MAENDVTIQINLDAKDAQAAIELFGRESTKVLKKTEDQSSSFFTTFKGGALKLAGTFAAITGGFAAIRKGINEAVEDAKLTRQIEASLRSVGEASDRAVEGVLDFADAIKDTTGVSDDLVKQTFIIAQSFGISTDKAKELTKAAIDLAAATGQDVETAVRQLGGTLDGSIGKVGNYGAEFRNLTKEQLEAGAAIDLVNQKFGGTAAKELNTFQGSVNQLANSWGDLLKQFGKTITESDTVIKTINLVASSLKSLTEFIKDFNKESNDSRSAGASILGVSGAYQQAADSARLLRQEAAAFRDINVGDQSKKVSDGFRGIVEQAQGATKATSNFLERLNSFPQAKAAESLGLTGKALEEAKKKAEEAAKAYETLLAKLRVSTSDEAGKIKARYDQEILEIRNVSKEKLFSAKQTATLIALVEKNRVDENNKYLLDEAKKANDELRKQAEEQKTFLEGVFANPFGNFAKRFQEELVRAIEFAKTGKDLGSPFKEGEIAASISGGIALALQGKAGAVKAVSQIGEIIGQSFGIPGLGAITELLSRGPEATKKFITEFINSVPDIIQAVAESIPVVVEALVDTLINKGGIVKIAAALVRAMVFAPVWARLGELAFGKPADELTKGVNEAFSEGSKNAAQDFKDFFNNVGPAFGKLLLGIGPALVDTFGRIWDGLEESFNRFDDVFNQQWNLFVQSFGGALTGFIEGIGGAFVTFFEGLGPAFLDAANNFAQSIGDALNPFTDRFLAYIQRFTESFQRIGSIFNELARVLRDFASLFTGLFSTLVNALGRIIDPIERLIKSIDGAFGKGGGQGLLREAGTNISAVFKGEKKVLPFSKGGMVYAADGFFKPRGTDTVPAMLTPGELVVPRDMVSELGAFLMRQSSDAPSSDSAVLASILATVQAPIVVKTEAKVNQQAFADIILQLNRQNARLSA